MDPTTWVLDRLIEYFPEGGMSRAWAVPALEEVIGTLEGRASGLVFGMVTSALDGNRIPQILALARDAIRSWG